MKPYARVKNIKFKSKLLPDGVSGLISVRDIPKGGENRGCTTRFGTESLFADELTQYAGERLAFVVITSSSIFI
jgi:abscisic-aldehyde oxidase